MAPEPRRHERAPSVLRKLGDALLPLTAGLDDQAQTAQVWVLADQVCKNLVKYSTQEQGRRFTGAEVAGPLGAKQRRAARTSFTDTSTLIPFPYLWTGPGHVEQYEWRPIQD